MARAHLEELTEKTFDKYNTDGPADRVYRAVSGHVVPPWPENKDGVVKHKWRAAVSLAAIAGGDAVVAMVTAGIIDPGQLAKAVRELYGCGAYDAFTNDTGPNPHAQGRGKAIGYSGNTA